MKVQAIKTTRVEPGDSLTALLETFVPALSEGCIVVVTSKVVSLCEGRVVAKGAVSKEKLITSQADAVVRGPANPYGVCLTLTDGMLMASAGIDESNAKDAYVLLPKDSQASAVFIWDFLRKRHNIKHLGVLITDSKTSILRSGVTGVALGWSGFEPLYSYIGKPDLYGNLLKMTRINLLDALATSAVLVMGEGAECTPMALIEDAPKLQFLDRSPSIEEQESIRIPLSLDLYAPLLLAVGWEEGRGLRGTLGVDAAEWK